MLYRLLMTAFYLKEKFCRKEEFDAIKAYFILNFPQFLGKYTTEWLLLSEPDITFINPKVLNLKFTELRDIHDQMTKVGDDAELELDFNKLVEDLGEEGHRVEQLRKQHLEKEEKELKKKKRVQVQLLEKRLREAEEAVNLKRVKSTASEDIATGTPNKSLNASFSKIIGGCNSNIYQGGSKLNLSNFMFDQRSSSNVFGVNALLAAHMGTKEGFQPTLPSLNRMPSAPASD